MFLSILRLNTGRSSVDRSHNRDNPAGTLFNMQSDLSHLGRAQVITRSLPKHADPFVHFMAHNHSAGEVQIQMDLS